MGDRSNVFIQTRRLEMTWPDGSTVHRWAGIGLYSHWHGTDLHDAAIDAATSEVARRRIGDESYFARIIVHRTLLTCAADADADTGFGLWTHDDGMPDNEHPVLVINALNGHHWFVAEGDHGKDEPTD
jgi:hypothetical protein